MRAFEHLHRFQQRSTLRTWLYRITVRVALSMLRQRRRLQWMPLSQAFPEEEEPVAQTLTPEQVHERQEFEQYFLRLLSTLPEKQRETFVLRYFEGLSYEEISQMLGTSIGGLKANYFLAVRKIAAALLNGPYAEEFRWRLPQHRSNGAERTDI